MIVVIGRPGLASATGRAGEDDLAGLPAAIAVEAAAAGARVELVGSIGDDPEGDRVAVRLGRAGVGHAALLRDPAGRTPVTDTPTGPMPRLDERDVELALRYIADATVIVIAGSVPSDVLRVVQDAASYHGATLVALVDPGGSPDPALADVATVLQAPAVDVPPFSVLVGRYAANLDGGTAPAEAFREAVRASGWEATGA
jgi:sugar/nucleoside kinase (ribokinase family)